MKDLLTALINIRAALRFLLRAQRVLIATTSPLTVELQDGTTLPGVGITGLTYTVGGAAIALTADRGQAIVLPTS